MSTITLFRGVDSWMTLTDGADGDEIYRLFGTHMLPTSWRACAPAKEVLADIQRRNPDCRVELRTHSS